jgi:hypothetical protein
MNSMINEGKQYIKEHNMGVPSFSFVIPFKQL